MITVGRLQASIRILSAKYCTQLTDSKSSPGQAFLEAVVVF